MTSKTANPIQPGDNKMKQPERERLNAELDRRGAKIDQLWIALCEALCGPVQCEGNCQKALDNVATR